MKRKIAFKTLGCRLNQFETDSIATDFYAAGHDIVPFNAEADVYIINTCTVTNQGDRKSRSAINQALKHKPNALVLVIGCMAESRKRDLDQMAGIDYIVDNKRKGNLLALVEAHFNKEIMPVESLKQDVFGFSVAEKGFHTRSMIKIQDGCNNFCTYCIVPFVRGRAVSRPHKDVIENIRRVLDVGYKEIVLTGVNISKYDDVDLSFEPLIENILNLDGNFRVRISSIEPEGFRNRFYELFAHEKLCPHLHLCLQSGSDAVLSRMGRKYNLLSFTKMTEALKNRYPLFNLTTDIIVGFPGETDADFNATCESVREIGFSHIHTFKYSVRSGTRAEHMPGKVPGRVMDERSRIIREISLSNKKAYRSKLLGIKQVVLVEKTDTRGFAKGYGEHYVPVVFKTKSKLHNYFEPVVLKEIIADSKDLSLTGEKIQ